jgi:hypothetical protein
MEKTIPFCPLAVPGEEELPRNLVWRDHNLKDSIHCKNLLKTMDHHALRSPSMPEGKEEGLAVEVGGGGSTESRDPSGGYGALRK